MAVPYLKVEPRRSIAVSWMDGQLFVSTQSQEATGGFTESWWGTVLALFHCGGGRMRQVSRSPLLVSLCFSIYCTWRVSPLNTLFIWQWATPKWSWTSVKLCMFLCTHRSSVRCSLYMWQSWVEIEHYSVASFDCVQSTVTVVRTTRGAHTCCVDQCMNTSLRHVHAARMSPTLNGSFALQRFECGNTIEIRNGIMFNFYPGLPHMVHKVITNVCNNQ